MTDQRDIVSDVTSTLMINDALLRVLSMMDGRSFIVSVKDDPVLPIGSIVDLEWKDRPYLSPSGPYRARVIERRVVGPSVIYGAERIPQVAVKSKPVEACKTR